MSRFVLVTNKKWHDELFSNLKRDMPEQWTRIKNKEDFHFQRLLAMSPEWIFIPHWSHIIPEEIYSRFRCVLFHMTDLPFGRGGSPLQNLIVRGFKKTKISAIKVSKGIDTGDVYLKEDLSLEGTAEEIFIRSSKVIYKMIKKIIKTSPEPVPQRGKIVEFKRRKPEESNIANLRTLRQVYDYIRMLDCEGYPKAFIEAGNFRFEFSKPSLQSNQTILANVRIIQKKENPGSSRAS